MFASHKSNVILSPKNISRRQQQTSRLPTLFHLIIRVDANIDWVHISSDNHKGAVVGAAGVRTMMPDANVFKQVMGSSRDSKLFYAF